MIIIHGNFVLAISIQEHQTMSRMMSGEKLKKLDRIRNQPSILLVGIPGPGLIGTLSVTYIVHSLKMEIAGEIENPDITPVVFIDNGEIFGPIRIYKSERVFAILSDIPVDYDLARGFSESVIEFSKRNHIDLIVLLSGIHVAEKNLESIKTYGLVTNEKLERLMYDNDIPKFLSGMIAGPDATILTYLKNSTIPTLALYTECNFFFPDPESAMNAIKTIAKILKKDIDLTEFKKQVNYLKLQGRQLMEETLNVLQQERERPPTMPPQIYK